MTRTALAATVAFLALALAVPAGADDDGLSKADFERLHALVRPKPGAWETIPWMTDLLAARALAARSRKPLFIWSMDGHPLGCT